MPPSLQIQTPSKSFSAHFHSPSDHYHQHRNTPVIVHYFCTRTPSTSIAGFMQVIAAASFAHREPSTEATLVCPCFQHRLTEPKVFSHHWKLLCRSAPLLLFISPFPFPIVSGRL
ncbi:GGDEF domain-containing protein [Sesbania bispinosa]|nr:GGDEF domain-containing protein [Sesbania bispinosa]